MTRRLRVLLVTLVGYSTSSRAALLSLMELIIGVAIILGCLYVFAKLADTVIEKQTFFFDTAITSFFYSLRSPAMTVLMKTLSFFGGMYVLGIAIISMIAMLYQKHKKDAAVFAFILFSGVALNWLLKFIFQRPRPHFMPLVYENSYSFPSGHAMNAFIFYTCLSCFIFLKMRNRGVGYVLIAGSILLIGLIGISRIYLGAHYPSDVLAGYAAGLCWFLLVILFEKSLLFFRLFRQYEVEQKY